MIRLCWRVQFSPSGRFVICEGKEGETCLFFAIGFVAWECRADYKELIQAVQAHAMLSHLEWGDKVYNQPTEETL